ncbi:MAG: M3 family peptidase, partial [Gammaproteobacteria bacterium]
MILALVLATPGCSPEPPKDNALLDPWTGPYGGVPAFDRMEVSDLKPALEAAMATKQAEIEAIVSNPEPPTFDNTLVALEDAGRDLDRVEVYLGIWRSNLSSPEFRQINDEMAPRLAEFDTAVYQNQALFDRIKAIHDNFAPASLDAEQQRLLKTSYLRFVRGGALLTGEARERYAAINKKLAELQT